jgi:hypothetical protein
MTDESTESRAPTADEARLIGALARLAGVRLADGWLDGLRVREMDDGGMGSLRFHPPRPGSDDRRLGAQAAEIQFTDGDGTVVLASLNLDQDGEPYELDVWKTDFSPLIRIPDPLPG